MGKIARARKPRRMPGIKISPMETRTDRNYHILVADDDDDDQYLISQALRETLRSHSVKMVNNGLEVVDHLFKDHTKDVAVRLPDFVLLDLNMPLLDGYAVLREIRSNEATRAIPVFILTTSRFEHDRQRSRELGATGFYSKPYQFEELKRIIKDICDESLLGPI